MRTHRIAAMGGDGIGPEVIKAGLQALEVCAERDGGFRFEVEHFDWGSDYYKKHGVMMPADGAEQLRFQSTRRTKRKPSAVRGLSVRRPAWATACSAGTRHPTASCRDRA